MNDLEQKTLDNIIKMINGNTYNCEELYGVIPVTEGLNVNNIAEALKFMGYKGRFEKKMGFTFVVIKNKDYKDPLKQE